MNYIKEDEHTTYITNCANLIRVIATTSNIKHVCYIQNRIKITGINTNITLYHKLYIQTPNLIVCKHGLPYRWNKTARIGLFYGIRCPPRVESCSESNLLWNWIWWCANLLDHLRILPWKSPSSLDIEVSYGQQRMGINRWAWAVVNRQYTEGRVRSLYVWSMGSLCTDSRDCMQTCSCDDLSAIWWQITSHPIAIEQR